MRRVYAISGERGFTLIELLVVMVILGVLAVVATLSVMRFMGSGTASAANSELHVAREAIAACMCDAGKEELDTSVPVNWDGSVGVVMGTGGDGTVYDASSYLDTKHLKATYTVAPSGQITGVTDQEWSGISWNNDHWEK